MILVAQTSPSWLPVLLVAIGVGVPLLTGGIIFLSFRGMQRAREREHAAFEAEGILRDSGRVPLAIHYRGFRAPGIYRGVGVNIGKCSLLLTQRHLGVLMGGRHTPYSIIARSDLARFTVDIADNGALRIHSDDPPGATGSIEYRVTLPDAQAWVSALVQAGARGHASG